jgi:hypothetical protein
MDTVMTTTTTVDVIGTAVIAAEIAERLDNVHIAKFVNARTLTTSHRNALVNVDCLLTRVMDIVMTAITTAVVLMMVATVAELAQLTVRLT